MDLESDFEIVEKDPYENSDCTDDKDYLPSSKRQKRLRKKTKHFGERSSSVSHDIFFKNLAAQKSTAQKNSSESPESNEAQIENIEQSTESNDLGNVSKENTVRSSDSNSNTPKKIIESSVSYKQFEHLIMTKLSSFESTLISIINSKFESYDNIIKNLQTQVARVEVKLNQRRSSISYEEMNDSGSYITELKSLGFPLNTVEKVNSLERDLSIEKYFEKLV